MTVSDHLYPLYCPLNVLIYILAIRSGNELMFEDVDHQESFHAPGTPDPDKVS